MQGHGSTGNRVVSAEKDGLSIEGINVITENFERRVIQTKALIIKLFSGQKMFG